MTILLGTRVVVDEFKHGTLRHPHGGKVGTITEWVTPWTAMVKFDDKADSYAMIGVQYLKEILQ